MLNSFSHTLKLGTCAHLSLKYYLSQQSPPF